MNCITLIGMPGCGKSTVGVVLAKTSGKVFVDTDILIQEHEGELLQNIIDHNGIGYFKEVEAKVLTELSKNNCVIATGGSAIYYPEAMDNLKGQGAIVYIKLSFETIRKRLDNIKTRLLLSNICKKLNVPLVHGSIGGWYGQVASILPDDNTMIKIYGNVKSDKGIEKTLGNLPFTACIIASLQCAECIKIFYSDCQ